MLKLIKIIIIYKLINNFPVTEAWTLLSCDLTAEKRVQSSIWSADSWWQRIYHTVSCSAKSQCSNICITWLRLGSQCHLWAIIRYSWTTTVTLCRNTSHGVSASAFPRTILCNFTSQRYLQRTVAFEVPRLLILGTALRVSNEYKLLRALLFTPILQRSLLALFVF